MNKQDVRDYITARLWRSNWGRGYSYWPIYLNGDQMNSMTELKKNAQEGDLVKIQVSSSRGWYEVDHMAFVIGQDIYLLEDWREAKEIRKKYHRPRDSYRQRVYDWQTWLPDGRELTQQEIEDLADEVYETYGYPGKKPAIVITKAKKVWSTYYGGWRHEIRLAAGWGQKEKYFLHELAHALIHTMGIGKSAASHGKEFVALFLELCELWLDASGDEIEHARTKGENLGTRHSYQKQE